MKTPTFVELQEEHQKQIKKGKTAVEALLDIWEWGYKTGYNGCLEDERKEHQEKH